MRLSAFQTRPRSSSTDLRSGRRRHAFKDAQLDWRKLVNLTHRNVFAPRLKE